MMIVWMERNNHSHSFVLLHCGLQKGNYTSAPRHGHATFEMSVTGEKFCISFSKIILFKDHTQTLKPNVCSYQKHPIKHTDFSFAGVYIAWK